MGTSLVESSPVRDRRLRRRPCWTEASRRVDAHRVPSLAVLVPAAPADAKGACAPRWLELPQRIAPAWEWRQCGEAPRSAGCSQLPRYRRRSAARPRARARAPPLPAWHSSSAAGCDSPASIHAVRATCHGSPARAVQPTVLADRGRTEWSEPLGRTAAESRRRRGMATSFAVSARSLEEVVSRCTQGTPLVTALHGRDDSRAVGLPSS